MTTANGLEALLAQQPILAIGAHPDDLALAASSLLYKSRNVYCVVVTTGAERNDNTGLAELRRNEEIAAMATLGLAPEQLYFLGIADQDSHRRLDHIVTLLGELMYKLRPGVIVSHDYEQGHPDHDIVAFAAAVAAHRRGIPCHAYPLYHRHNGAVQFCRFREASAARSIHRLDNLELSIKFKALSAYVSQMNVIKDFPLHIESFRPLDLESCNWLAPKETVYEQIPSIAIDPDEVTAAIGDWLNQHSSTT